MDYDDNDFQSQNFQLGCEDNTKFPPSSPSYTLPKYELDENLQVHLGFDIDQEVLLGIQCQQDNHWIEDFSRGSSRIEFSPSAADSCSISRHNNVWSEATSSESVEMLLKSVGQDDGANKQTCMEEQDACDGFGNLNDQMDSSLNTDRTLPSVPGDFIDTGPAVPPDKFVESLPGPSKDASGELARGECTLETRKDEESGSESMIPVNLISSEKCSLDPKVTFWTNSLGDGSMEKSEGDGHHSSAEMVASCNQENIALERVQLDSCSTSEPSLGSDAVELNSKKLSQQETTDKLGGPMEVYPPEVGNPILSSDAHMNVESNTHQVRSEISCPNTEESSHIVRNMQETYILGTKGDKIFEGCLTHSDAQHAFTVPDMPKGVDQIEGKEVFLSVTENKQHFEGKNSSDGEGNLPSSVVNVSSPADLATGEVLNTNDGHDRLGTNPAKTTSWKLESRVLVDKVPEVGVCIPDIGLSVPDQPSDVNNAEGCREFHPDYMGIDSVPERVESGIPDIGLSVPDQPSDVNNAEGCRAFHPDYMGIDSVPERVESDVTKLASSNKMEGVSQLPTGNKQAMNLVEKQGAGRPSLPVSDIVNFNSEEAAVESSLELGSSISVSQAESEQHTVTVCSSSVGVPSYTATQSASLAEKSISIKSNDDPQVSMARTGAKEDHKELSGDSTIHMSDQQLVFNVKKHEEGIPSFTISDVVNLDEKEEPVDGICTKLGSSVSFSNVEMEQHTICSTVIDLPSDITVFSSALVENSPNNKYNNELQVSMNSTAAQESGKDLSEDSTIHSSVQQLVSDVEKPEAGIPSLPVSEIVYLDKKEELLDGASTELLVSVSKAGTEQCTVCSTALALPSDTAAQSSAVAEKSLSIKFNDEPQLSMSTTAAQVYGKELSGNSIIGASVEQLVSDFEKQGAEIPSSPVSDIVNFDKEEPVDGISTELGSSMSVSMPETEQHRVCTAFDLPYDAAAQSSALAEKSLSIKLNNEQVPTTTTTTQGYGKELFGDSTIHTSVQQLVVDVEKQKTTIPILPVSDIVNFDKEEPVGISTEFGSLVSVSMAETEQHTVCSTVLDLPSHTAATPSAFEEIGIKSNEEPQVSMALTAAQEYDIANYDKKHEPTDGISRELDSSESVSKAETVQHAVSTTALNLPSDTTGQSSALAERSLTIKSNADPQVSVAIPAAQESGDLIIHASISLLQEKNAYESTTSSLRAEVASIGDIPAESVPSSAHESSQGDEVNKCEEKSSSPLAENVIEQNALEAVSGLSSTEPNCGSPTVISSKEQSQTAEDYHEENGRSIVQNDPDDLPQVHIAIDGQADMVKSTANEVSESFTFEVGSLADLSQRETTNGWKTFSNIHPSGLHQTEEVPPTESGACQTDSGLFEETRHESCQVSNEKPVHVMPDKMRDKNTVASGGTSPKGTSTKAKSAKKSSQMHKAEKATNITSPAPNFSGSFSRAMQMEELRQYPLIDGSTKQPAGPPVQTTNLPDLNSLASPVLFRQPFTDLQQVQLRAQIFVYGSLIQSAAPDEACMKSAFADSDSERTMWESTWRVAVERCYSQKSPLSNLETPVHSHLGSRISEQVSRSDTLHGKPLRSPAGKSSCKSETPPPVLNPTMSLSSPLWSIATSSRDALHPSSVPRVSVLDPQQSPSPLSPYQSSQMRQYMGNTTPWLSQVAAPGPPWVFSPQNSTLDVGIPGTESVQVTPMRDILVPCTTSVHLASPSLLASTVGPMNVLPGQAVLMDVKNTISAPSEELSSGGQKSRKRKKNPSPQEVIQMLQVTHPGAASTPVTKHLSTSAGTLASHTSSKISDGNFVATSSPVVPSSHFQIISGGGDTCQRVILPEEISSRVELAKLYQEDAASFAASAVKHCQGIWSQLSIQKKSGLVSCDEVKLASAAVAAAAAASVAKAAAEAAKLASNAALQAKLMADEVLRIGMLGPDTIFPDAGVSFRKATPASNLKGKEKANSSSSLIVAAREAAKRRVIAASAASKQAENLEAIVKAAEIAVEAVAQAGAVIAMGDPVPLKLNELLALGLDGYWKLQQVTAGHKEEGIAKASEGRHKMSSERPSNKKDTKENTEKQSPSKVVSKQSEEVLHGLVNGIPRESGTSERTLEQHKGCKQSDLAKNIGVVLESEIGSRETIFTSQNDEGERDENTGKSAENGIQEGSVVEVFTDEDGLRGVWFLAKVLNVKDGKAFICYDELLEEEGSEHIKEWVPLEGEADKPPRIRPAHPLTPAMKYEGTRKRRRAAIGNYAWSVGDRVDVWMRDGWWEAIVSEKDKDDDTKLTVRFPAEGGSSSAVRLWSLRPSLIWKNGQWIDWPRENNFCLDKSDMPQEKRQKFGRHEVGTDSQREEQLAELSKDMGVEESWSQMLSAKDRIFTVGKKAGVEAPKVKRTGLQQEGSKVIFGVPKPGKKRKFMEVSKHYDADEARNKASEGADSMKLMKYLMPQGSCRGWRNTPKVEFRGKQMSDPKPKVLRPKAQTILSKSVIEKDSSTVSVQDPLANAKSLVEREESNSGREESNSGKQKLPEVGSSSNNIRASEPEGPVLVSSNAPSFKKSSAVVTEKGVKGKLGPAGGKLAIDAEGSGTNDLAGKPVSESIEPRRSNRRIQPTSRLLEGLQSSSLVVSKLPPLSHDKDIKARQRSGSSSRGSHG